MANKIMAAKEESNQYPDVKLPDPIRRRCNIGKLSAEGLGYEDTNEETKKTFKEVKQQSTKVRKVKEEDDIVILEEFDYITKQPMKEKIDNVDNLKAQAVQDWIEQNF